MSYGYTTGDHPSDEHISADGILVTKRTVLSNPGTKLNNVYYSAVNTIVGASQITATQGRFTASLTSSQFGAQSTVVIPNGSFVSTVILHLKLPALPVNAVLNRGWGFSALKSVGFLLGSSNVPQITIQGQSIYQLMLGQTEGVLKRSEMLALAGQETFGDGVIEPTCDLIIPLPFSTYSGKDHPLPFDTNLLQNPITLNIQLAPLREFCGGIGGAAWNAYGFKEAQVSMKLSDMLNRDDGLRRRMQQNPDLIYGYPFNHFQSFQSSFKASGPTLSKEINLLGFINADLLGIVFSCVKATDLSPARANDVINPLIYQEVSDVLVQFNGLTMHSTVGQQHKLTNMNSVNDASYVQQSMVNLPAVSGTGPFTSSPLNCYPVFIDFAQCRSMNFYQEYENVWRISNNVLTLNLKLPNVAVETDMVLFATYIYNGIADIKGGETEIFFS